MNSALKSWSVKRKLGFLITTFILGFVVFGAVAFSTLNALKVRGPYYERIIAGKDAIADVLPPPKYIIESYLTVLRMLDAPLSERKDLEKWGDKLERDYHERHQHWKDDTILKDTPISEAMLVTSYEPAVKFYEMRDNEFIPALNRGDFKRAKSLALGPMTEYYQQHRKGVNAVVEESIKYDVATEKEADAVILKRTGFMLFTSLALIGFVGIGLGTVLSRSISRSLSDTINALSITSAEMAATVEQQERTAVLQSAAVHETTTTMDELDASFGQTAEMVKVAADTAQQAAENASDGLLTVHQTLDGMARLKDKVAAVSEQISNLSEQTGQISSITRVVGDLASQTNMLALNAAVEAARAGEHGKGFGVVAAEIRKLADESKKSAERIDALVEDIRRATDATVMATEEGTKTVEADIRLAELTAESFNGIVASSGSALEAAQQTLLAVPQQVTAVRQVLAAMEDLNRGAKETADGLGQTKASVDSLREAAYILKSMV